MKRFLVIFEKTTTGYSAYIPDLPGCISTGATREECEQHIYDAIQFHLDGMREEGLAINEVLLVQDRV